MCCSSNYCCFPFLLVAPPLPCWNGCRSVDVECELLYVFFPMDDENCKGSVNDSCFPFWDILNLRSFVKVAEWQFEEGHCGLWTIAAVFVPAAKISRYCCKRSVVPCEPLNNGATIFMESADGSAMAWWRALFCNVGCRHAPSSLIWASNHSHGLMSTPEYYFAQCNARQWNVLRLK